MREFKLEHGEVFLPLTSSREIKLRASAKKEITVYGVCETEEIPLAHGENINLKETLSRDFIGIRLKVYGNTAFGYWFHENQRQGYETLNDLDPPALPEPRTDNLVAKLHHELGQLRRQGGPSVLIDDLDGLGSRYAIDDDDYAFEEELFSSQQSDADSAEPQPSQGREEPPSDSTEPESPQEPPSEEAPRQMAAE